MNKKVLSLLMVLIMAMFLISCGSDDDSTKNTGDTIENDTSVAFVGKVVTPNGDPMSGVKVELISDTKQTATTDANGNWLINVDLGKIVATPGGGGQETTDNNLGDNPDQIVRNFPVTISQNGFGTYRYEAQFSATIGYTDGTGAVMLLSKTGTVQPTVVLHPTSTISPSRSMPAPARRRARWSS